jgi:hypothetical protein
VAEVKRILLLGLAFAAFAVPAGAHAAAPCRDKIYNEWYSTGKISTNYPTGCYRDALKHIPPDAQVYSNLSGDIKAAMQAAIAHQNDPGGGGPTAVGSGSSAASTGPNDVKGGSQTTTTPHPVALGPLSSSSSPGGGVPTPIIVLGAVAILLALAGLIGTGVQQTRKRRAA